MMLLPSLLILGRERSVVFRGLFITTFPLAFPTWWIGDRCREFHRLQESITSLAAFCPRWPLTVKQRAKLVKRRYFHSEGVGHLHCLSEAGKVLQTPSCFTKVWGNGFLMSRNRRWFSAVERRDVLQTTGPWCTDLNVMALPVTSRVRSLVFADC